MKDGDNRKKISAKKSTTRASSKQTTNSSKKNQNYSPNKPTTKSKNDSDFSDMGLSSKKKSDSSFNKKDTKTKKEGNFFSLSSPNPSLNENNSGVANSGKDLRTVRLSSVEDLPPGFTVHTDKRKFYMVIPILDRYILREIFSPFLVSLAFFTMVYMVLALQKMIGLFVGKGVDPFRLLDYFGYLLANTLPMTIPMACLMSGIMAAGRLSGDSEITAIRSAGVSFPRIYINFLAFGFVMALLVGYLNFYLSPENTRKMNEFNKWILAYNPLLAITPGQFSGDKTQDLFEKRARTMYTEGMNSNTGELKGVQIREWEIFLEGNEYFHIGGKMIPMGGSRIIQIINAAKGNLVEKLGPDGEYEKSIRLKDGWILEWSDDRKTFSITDFRNGEMDYNIPKGKEKKTLELNVKPETFSMPVLFQIRNNIESEGLEKIPGLETLQEMGVQIKGLIGLKQMVEQMKIELAMGAANGTLTPDQMTQQYSVLTQLMALMQQGKKVLTDFNVEIHRRIAMPISCLIFFFISFPLGLVVKRSGKGMSFTLAVVFLMIYFTFFTLGSTISYNDKIPDWIGPWSANILIALLSINIMIKRTDMDLPKPIQKILDKISDLKSKLTDRLESSNIWGKIKKIIKRGP
ncbi:LptF/LptG family permease [Leptospira interrogans]|uniref:Permease, YjgP/YjgQ family n=2 Tax=Leptospira interrogans TaxID=173 RepID=A0A0F6ID59_LEPIR|nr:MULTISPECIES: LptF/LptG family permease [Leptospira]EJO79407.1 permease, YjgP/YjgQ family [Leptospira interrogans serovar Pomona str. Kennewicki LC82-25]EKR37796.1 permease, YjgP/YjgQ family [Leptospira interrogans serovar Hebdomadis str. R499]EMF31614.1 permease, YjgP/YjgQ family [Leptospira interrogans serovar Pomona str. Fox 32256]EMI68143.1 permease, YjgP/YjgQ family [Leptospira interrogans serovar Pomona str. CSL10083]EMJ35984.1 permease, YjgP/YjgQ family [Leptospira interrogans str. F